MRIRCGRQISIVDVGPGAGVHGGSIVAAGPLEKIVATPESITGQYLSGARKIPVPTQRRSGNGHWLKAFGCRENNLQNIDVAIPLGTFTCVTGVSGSGKSSLVNEILYKKLAAKLNRARLRAGRHDHFEGIEYLDKVIAIDQSPIGGRLGRIRRRIRACSMISATCLPRRRRRRPGATAGAVLLQCQGRPLRGLQRRLGRRVSRCISCRISMSPARSAAAAGITGRRWRRLIRGRISRIFWI